MQAIILKIILASIPSVLPVLISSLVSYLKSVQDNPIRQKEFNEMVRLFVAASQDLPDRSVGVENADSRLEERYKELKAQREKESGT